VAAAAVIPTPFLRTDQSHFVRIFEANRSKFVLSYVIPPLESTFPAKIIDSRMVRTNCLTFETALIKWACTFYISPSHSRVKYDPKTRISRLKKWVDGAWYITNLEL
jgi:hypothetical protein